MKRLALPLLFSAAIQLIAAQTPTQKTAQPHLGYRSAALITVNGLQFKDLNRNGKLDKYEDWRLPIRERTWDLLSKMSLEEKVGFMLISTATLKNEGTNPSSEFNEEDRVTTTNIFTHKPLPVAMMSTAGTTKGVTQYHLRHFIFRANVSAKMTAEWANRLQALCESDGLGIPALIASNPRNHLTKDAAAGLSVGKTVFSTWPGELGMSAMHDLSLVREFANIARQEWDAVGIRKGYMYMADLSTEPRWQRIEGTFGEDAEWVGKMITEIVLGFQGTKLNTHSVVITTKHFPGGGAGEGGQDPHFDWGKYEHFPGKMFENNLIPFKAAIKAGTAAIMPYYSIPRDTKYPQMAYAYNKEVINGLLRKQLGFTGIINSDTGPIEMMPWGVEDLSIAERYRKSLEAGVNIYSGTADPTQLLATVKGSPVHLALVDSAVYKLLMEKFTLGLFEDPYVDADAAEKLVGNAHFQERANLAMRKSVVLLRNEQHLLPLKTKTKIYFESYSTQRNAPSIHVQSDSANTETISFVKTPEEADVILLWLTPTGKALFQSDGSPIFLSLSKNNIDVAHVNALTAKKPTILAINFTNPWVINEVYNASTSKNIQSVIATFNTTHEALLDIVTGKFNPTGKMPFTTPVSEEVVLQQDSDVPGYLKGAKYPLFKLNEGLHYGTAIKK